MYISITFHPVTGAGDICIPLGNSAYLNLALYCLKGCKTFGIAINQFHIRSRIHLKHKLTAAAAPAKTTEVYGVLAGRKGLERVEVSGARISVGQIHSGIVDALTVHVVKTALARRILAVTLNKPFRCSTIICVTAVHIGAGRNRTAGACNVTSPVGLDINYLRITLKCTKVVVHYNVFAHVCSLTVKLDELNLIVTAHGLPAVIRAGKGKLIALGIE